METVTNVVNAASEAIWGKQSSTAQADGKTANNETAGQEPLSGATGAGTVDEPFDKGNTLPIRSAARNETGGEEPVSGVQGAGTASEPFDKGNTQPSTTERLNTEERGNLVEEGALPKVPTDDSSKPTKISDVVPTESATEDRSAIVGQEGGAPLGKETGTGEEWTKTTGVAAEGGNFDATNPGAGKEASRLLEETEVKREISEEAAAKKPVMEEKPTEKPSKMERLKDKLHIGSSKHA